ncbi:MAG: glycosyltransferase, partial [Acidobacteriota bacterium]
MLTQFIPILHWLSSNSQRIGAFTDSLVLAALIPLSIAILICGVDDLVVDIAWGWLWLKSKLMPAARLFPPGPRQLAVAPRVKIAIFVPLWQEHEVIGHMLEHNLAAIRYDDYHFFVGCYPNDPKSQAAVGAVSRRFPQVHLAMCPHDGPTSKADCLNWVFQCMLLVEEETGERFEIVMTHD